MGEGRETYPYEDDGISQEYLNGKGTWTGMTWDDRARRLTIEPAPPRGATNIAADRVFRVVLLPENTTRAVTYSEKQVQVVLR